MLRCVWRPCSILLCLFTCVFAGLSLLSAAPESGKKYALLVGINEYDHAKLLALQYAENDVADLETVLRKAGYEVVVLSGAAGKKNASRQPTKANITQQLAALLKKYHKGDTILLAFAGHGLQFDDAKECYFCPRDAKPFKEKTDSLLALSAIYQELEQAVAGTKILLVDACRNDPTPGRGSRGIDADSAPPPPKGVAALFSCSANQRAYESTDLKHGIFFHYVLEALQGKAGANDKGEVTWGRLTEYVPEKVETQVPKLIGADVKQTPNMKADLVGRSPVLVRLDNSQKPGDTVVKEQPMSIKFDLGDGVQMEWVLLNAKGNASFQMGSPDSEKDALDREKPRHQITLTKPFYLGKFHVTRGQFAAFVKATNYKTEAETGDGAYVWNVAKETYQKSKDHSWKNPGFPQTDAHPVVCVSWNDAKRFCRWLEEDAALSRQWKTKLGQRTLSFRLPSEAEWEYACRAGTTTPFHFGSALNGKQANCDGNYPYGAEEKGPYLKGTSKVGNYKENAFDLYDMHGNAWQWCEDYYGPYEAQDQRDPLRTVKHSEEFRVLRGGSWGNLARFCRASSRLDLAPDLRGNFCGFRPYVRLD